jgi:hypothetical protein
MIPALGFRGRALSVPIGGLAPRTLVPVAIDVRRDSPSKTPLLERRDLRPALRPPRLPATGLLGVCSGLDLFANKTIARRCENTAANPPSAIHR